MMMLDYKGGREGSQESGKKWLPKMLWFYVISAFYAEFYLNFKFIIIKIIMYSNCSITSTCDLFSKIFEVFNETSLTMKFSESYS